MKIIKYNLCTMINHGTEEEPQIEELFTAVTMGWNETNEEIAKIEAYNGEYTIEDDGQSESESTDVTWDDLAEALQSGVNSI